MSPEGSRMVSVKVSFIHQLFPVPRFLTIVSVHAGVVLPKREKKQKTKTVKAAATSS